jgi:hypothetical protein
MRTFSWPGIARAPEGLPVGHRGAHVGDRGDAVIEQLFLRGSEGGVAV